VRQVLIRRAGNPADHPETPDLEVCMNGLTLYGTTPFDLIDRMLSDDHFFAPEYRSPAIDVREEGDRYVVEAELPGLSEKDIRLELKDGTLILSTAKKESSTESNGKIRWLRRERREFRFSRSFSLPEDVDAERIDAKFRDGLLTIALPRKPESAPRIVPVKVA
jgi:HSP20 family protein